MHACAKTARMVAAMVLAYVVVLAATPNPNALGASSSITVTLGVASSATLDASLCLAGAPGRTDFGTVQPGTTAVTTSNCQVSFGSSNDTSQLRVWQTDRVGSAMWLPAWGDLDLTIGGGDGMTREVYSAAGNDYYLDAERQPDGRILVVGRQGSSANRTLVARYLPNGTRDTTGFDSPNGYVFLGANTTTQEGQSVKVLTDGSIIVGAQSQDASANLDFTLYKLDSAGSLVAGFGVGGRLVRSINAASDALYGICIDESRNRAYAVGNANGDFGVLAFDLTTGADVAAFGPVQTRNVSGVDEARNDCLVDASGNVVVFGYDGGGGGRAVIMRYTPTGALDATFDGPSGSGNGVVALDLDTTVGAGEAAWGGGFAPDGDILITGNSETGGLGIKREMVARLDGTSGALDTSFGGGDGWQAYDATPGFSAFGTELQVLPDGRFYTMGGSPSAPLDAWVRRYLADGTPDPSFGGDGQAQWDWETSAVGADTRGIAIGTDGELWVVGEDNDGDDEAIIAKLGSLPVNDYGAGANWTAGGFFGICVQSVTGTGSAVPAPWSAGACTQAIGANWGAVRATSGTAGSKVAQLLTAGASDGVAQLRFGVRVPSAQRPGSYLAPITFEVLAPDGP